MSEKRTALTLEQKCRIILECQKPGVTRASVANEWKISKSTVTQIWKKREELLDRIRLGTAKRTQKRKREGKYADLEEALFLWLKERYMHDDIPTNTIIKQKAVDLSVKIGIIGFTSNDGWFSRWKNRYNIPFQIEKLTKSVETNTIDTRIELSHPNLLEVYAPKDIFNAGETSLFYKFIDSCDYAEAVEKAAFDGKQPKDRITILVCANTCGTEKRPLLVVGKPEKPRCFPVDQSKLPVDYRGSFNAWMTAAIFEEWITKWNTELQQKNRYICLVIDDSITHRSNLSLSNIKLVLISSNSASSMLPLSIGIIPNLKGHYRSLLLQRIIHTLKSDSGASIEDLKQKTDILEAVTDLADAWKMVTESTIRDYFSAYGFKNIYIKKEETFEPLNPLYDVLIPEEIAYDDFLNLVHIDAGAVTQGEITDEELIAKAVYVKKSKLTHIESECDDSLERPSDKEVLHALTILRRYATTEGLQDPSISDIQLSLEKTFSSYRS